MHTTGISVTFQNGNNILKDYHEEAKTIDYANYRDEEYYLLKNNKGQILASYNPLYVLEIEEHESE